MSQDYAACFCFFASRLARRRNPPAAHKPGEVFRDCPDCEEIVVIPPGEFDMGSADSGFEGPVLSRNNRRATFAIGRREVTFAEWDLCVAGGGCKAGSQDHGWGRGTRPAIEISWDDATDFVHVAVEKDRPRLSAADRGGMGIFRSSRQRIGLLVGQGHWDGPRHVPRLWRRHDAPDSSDGSFRAERLRPLRHVRQRRRMGPGLLERQLQGRAEGRNRLDVGRLHAACAARGGSFADKPPAVRSSRPVPAMTRTCATTPMAFASPPT